MNKKQFESYVLRNISRIKSFHCNVTISFDLDRNECCWLDVYISGDEYTTIFCSDDFPVGSKEVYKLQKLWAKKLNTWINPNWGIPLEVIEVSV